MARPRRLRSDLLLLIITLAYALAGTPASWASQARQELSGPVPCALIEDFSGAVSVMDPSRTRTVEVVKKAGIPCGGWVSVGKGWVRIQHRDGFELHGGGNTFFQLPEPNADGKGTGDGLVLYKGEAYARVAAGAARLRAITPNARAVATDGQLILVYNHVDEETQLVVLAGSARFENRFQSGREIRLAAGEASDLGFRQLRVVPSAPKALVISSLKNKLDNLRVPEKEQGPAVRKALARAERKFASDIEVAKASEAEAAESAGAGEPARSVASLEFSHSPKAGKGRQEPAPVEDKEGEFLQAHFIQRMSAGEKVGERVLFPKKFLGKPQRVKIELEDPAAKFAQESRKNEEKEKRRLIEELSQIRLD